jgi:hypothetical protein
VATIKDTLFLGVEQERTQETATVEGRLELSGASVRQLVDNQFVGDTGKGDSEGRGREGTVNFVYERLSGDGASKSSLRKKWLARQPPDHLKANFRPQPFEQLVKVLRAMGHNSDADEIALQKRIYLWKAKPWWAVWSPPFRHSSGTV